MLIFALLITAAYLASMACVGYFIFSPFKKAIARVPLLKKRFQLTDLFAFFLSFQLGFGLINFAFPDIRWTPETAFVVTTVLLLISGIAWFYGLRIIWRTNISAASKRIVLMGLIMPFGFVLPTALLPLIMSSESIVSFWIRLVLLVSSIILLRYLSIWVLSETDPGPKPKIIE